MPMSFIESILETNFVSEIWCPVNQSLHLKLSINFRIDGIDPTSR